MRTTRGFTLVELLVVVAIIGVLVSIMLPAIHNVKDAAARIQCANNLKQQGLALHGYHDAYGMFPPAKINPGMMWSTQGIEAMGPQDFYRSGTYKIYNHTGFTLLLPYIEQEALYREYKFDQASCGAYMGPRTGNPYVNPGFEPQHVAGGTDNDWIVATPIAMYLCPADDSQVVDEPSSLPEAHSMFFRPMAARTSYLMCIYNQDHESYGLTPKDDSFFTTLYGQFIDLTPGVFRNNVGLRMEDIADGTTRTIAIGETRFARVNPDLNTPHWGAGHYAAMTGAMRSLQALGSLHINSVVKNGNEVDRDGALRQFGFGSWHPNGANFLFADGSVQFLLSSMPFPVFDALGTIAGGEMLD